MAVKMPNISINRSGTSLTLTLINFEAGDTWNIYRANDKLGNLNEVIREHDTSSYVDTININKNYAYLVSLNNAPITNFLIILVDSGGTEPAYITFEAKSGITVTEQSYVRTVSWGTDITVNYLTLDGFSLEGFLSNPFITFGKNQTL